MAQGEIPLDFITEESGRIALAPERFKNAGEIRDCCDQMIMADRIRVPWRASIDGLVDGNATYRLATTKAKGQGWRARVNYRGAEGVIQARQTPFFDLVTEVPCCVEVCLDYGSGPQKAEWENIMGKNFNLMLMRRWRQSFNYHIPVQQLEMLKHGIGYHIWSKDKYCWTPDTPISGMILFPDGCTLNIQEKLDYMMIRDFVPGHQLYNYIRDEEKAEAQGWNVDMVWSALSQTSKTNYRMQGVNRWNVEQAQREYKQGDIGTSTARESGVWLDHLFVKEIETQKISQYTIAEGISNNQRGEMSDPWRDCLFRKRNRHDDWPFVLFNYDIGSGGFLHSVRGLGARTKDFYELMNRVTNAMADQVLVGSLITAKQTGTVDPDKMRLMRLGMLNIIPQGLEVATGVQFPPLAQGPIALTQMLEETMAKNNQSYMQGTPEPTDRETAQSYTMRAQNQAQIGKGVHSLYTSNWQQALERMFRVASMPQAAIGNSMSARLAAEFQTRCYREGVPPEAFRNVYEVKEVVSSGAGSAAARIDALLTIMKLIYPTTTEDRKINIERDLVSTLVSGSKVDRYARNQADTEIPTSDDSLAVQENNGLALGGDAEATPTQDHVGHLERHFARVTPIVQQVMQAQLAPAQGLTIIQKFGRHIGAHLKFLQGNPLREKEYKQFYAEFTALSVIADKLQQQVAANQNRTRPTPEEKVSDNLKIGLADVAAKERVGMAQVQTQGRIDLSKLAIQGRIQAAEVAVKGATNGAKKPA